MLGLLIAATVTGGTTALGALPFLVLREVPRRTYDTLLGFGAGLMLAAATLGLLPAALHNGRLSTVLVAFCGGVALLVLIDRMIPHQHAGGHHAHMALAPAELSVADVQEHEHCHHPTVDERARHQGLLVLGAMSLHRLPEGFAIGAGFAAARLHALGMLLAIAVSIQNAVEGAVMAAPLRRGGLAPGRLFAVVGATGLVVPVAALAGFYFSAAAGGAVPVALALAAGALLYLTCSEIIPESHSHGNERYASFGLIAGFVLVLVIQALTGDAG